MSGKNRFLKGDPNTVIAPVHGYHEVEAGDFMVIDGTSGMLGVGTTADSYAVPFKYLKMATASAANSHHQIWTHFVGVAMEDSPSGVTENITIATSGVVRYPLHSSQAGTGVTIGAKISSVSNTIAAGASNQFVAIGTAGIITSTAYLGYVTKSESGASFVDFQLRTAFGPAGSVPQ